MGTFKKVVEGTKSGWNNMNKGKRNTMVFLITSIILSALIFSYFTRKVSYATIFTNLELEDAGNIVEDLKSRKVAYRLGNNGRNILIDEKHLDSYRLQLAMEGNMPDKSTGFEIFDDIGLMVTDEDRKIMYQRAITGELQRSIMSLDAVNTAKIHLVLPERTIFETQLREASASVIIDLNPTRQITDNMIKGIAALVSGAVDNLPEKNIKIIDSKGNLLSGILEGGDSYHSIGILDQYQKMQESFQQNIESNISEILGAALGRDRVKVSVYADLDFDSEETTTITYSDPVIRSEQISGDSPAVSDQGNIGDNNSNVIDEEDDDIGVIYERITNNELSSETRTAIKAPGKVNRLSTSVIYDGSLTKESSDKIQSIVAAATGYDEDRGDLISIEDIAFDKTYEMRLKRELDRVAELEKEDTTIFGLYKDQITLGLYILLGMILIVAVIMMIAFGRRKDVEPQEDLPLYAPVPNMVMETEEEIEKLEIKINSNEVKAKDFTEENPEVAAELIRAWIKD